jgi:hypothetical protein
MSTNEHSAQTAPGGREEFLTNRLADRSSAMGALIRAADRLLDGALGNGHSISVSKSHFDALIDAVRKAKAS